MPFAKTLPICGIYIFSFIKRSDASFAFASIMKNLWNNAAAAKLNGDLLKLRVYTSQLLGAEPDLVLHGGGNTSVKISERNLFGDTEDLIYVKGSGWDLATIKEEGFAPVRMSVLLKM